MIGLNLFNSNEIASIVKGYEVSSIIYLAFSLLRLWILSEIISIINILLFKTINNRVVIILNVIFYILIAGTPYYSTMIINSIKDMPWFIGCHFFGYMYIYRSFFFELLCFVLYILVLIIITEILKIITLKYMKSVTK